MRTLMHTSVHEQPSCVIRHSSLPLCSAVIDTLQEENENLKKDLALAGSKQNENKVSHIQHMTKL